ncbi:MAG: hypothetical protein ACWGQW_02520 [bacterium]
MRKMSIPEAVELMLKQNRESARPLPEKDLKRTIDELVVPMMRQGLVSDVEPDPTFKPSPKPILWILQDGDLDGIADLLEPGDVILKR